MVCWGVCCFWFCFWYMADWGGNVLRGHRIVSEYVSVKYRPQLQLDGVHCRLQRSDAENNAAGGHFVCPARADLPGLGRYPVQG